MTLSVAPASYRFTEISEALKTQIKNSFDNAADMLQRVGVWPMLEGCSVRWEYYTDNGEWRYFDTAGDEKGFLPNPSGAGNLKRKVFFKDRVPVFSVVYAWNGSNQLISENGYLGEYYGFYDIVFNAISSIIVLRPNEGKIFSEIAVNYLQLQFKLGQQKTISEIIVKLSDYEISIIDDFRFYVDNQSLGFSTPTYSAVSYHENGGTFVKCVFSFPVSISDLNSFYTFHLTRNMSGAFQMKRSSDYDPNYMGILFSYNPFVQFDGYYGVDVSIKIASQTTE